MKFGFILTKNDQDEIENSLFEGVASIIKMDNKTYSNEDILELVDTYFGSEYRENLISRYKDHLKHYSDPDNKVLDEYVNSCLIDQINDEIKTMHRADKLTKIKFWLNTVVAVCVYILMTVLIISVLV